MFNSSSSQNQAMPGSVAASPISVEVEVEDTRVKPLREGSKSTLQGIIVVATLLPKAPKMLRLMCNGPAGAHMNLFGLAEIGGIPSKGAYPPRSKVAKLPFNGAKFVPVALVRSALCVTAVFASSSPSIAVYVPLPPPLPPSPIPIPPPLPVRKAKSAFCS